MFYTIPSKYTLKFGEVQDTTNGMSIGKTIFSFSETAYGFFHSVSMCTYTKNLGRGILFTRNFKKVAGSLKGDQQRIGGSRLVSLIGSLLLEPLMVSIYIGTYQVSTSWKFSQFWL